jgi:hypothetical protein
MRTREWYYQKALAATTAYQHRYGRNPTKNALCLMLAVALHETQCGDAWNHSGNWGAVQRRRMTPEERAAVKAGKVPPPRDAFEELHGDSSPINGKYQTWFYKFPAGIKYPPADLEGDQAGAWILWRTLIDERASIAAEIDRMIPETLARRMYDSGYYEGFHDPRQTYFLIGGKWIPEDKVQPGMLTPETPKQSGKELNIQSYAGAIRRGFGEFNANLGDWGFRSP